MSEWFACQKKRKPLITVYKRISKNPFLVLNFLFERSFKNNVTQVNGRANSLMVDKNRTIATFNMLYQNGYKTQTP